MATEAKYVGPLGKPLDITFSPKMQREMADRHWHAYENLRTMLVDEHNEAYMANQARRERGEDHCIFFSSAFSAK